MEPPDRKPIVNSEEISKALSEKTTLQTFTGDSPFQVQPLHYAPDTNADEATIRAREAIIATGVFVGHEEMIRAGLLDHTHGVQAALELQRYAHMPLNQLVTVPHGPTRALAAPQTQVVVEVYPSVWKQLGHFIASLHYRFTKLWFRYSGMKAHFDKEIAALNARLVEKNSTLEKARERVGFLSQHSEQLERELRHVRSKFKSVREDLRMQLTDKQRLTFHEILLACDSDEERATLAELAKEAIWTRKHGKVGVTIVKDTPPPAEVNVFCPTCKTFMGRRSYAKSLYRDNFNVHETGKVTSNIDCDACARARSRKLKDAIEFQKKHIGIRK